MRRTYTERMTVSRGETILEVVEYKKEMYATNKALIHLVNEKKVDFLIISNDFR